MLLKAIIAVVVCSLSACNRRASDLKMDIPSANQSDDRGLFLSWKHPVSHRTAILEEIDGMVWLYLSEPRMTQPARDCPAFVTTPPPDSVDWEHVKRSGNPPGISKDVASDQAIIQNPETSEFSSVWSTDGESVGLIYRGDIICMIVASERRGHSKALAQSCPLGEPFDDLLYRTIFTPQNPQTNSQPE